MYHLRKPKRAILYATELPQVVGPQIAEAQLRRKLPFLAYVLPSSIGG